MSSEQGPLWVLDSQCCWPYDSWDSLPKGLNTEFRGPDVTGAGCFVASPHKSHGQKCSLSQNFHDPSIWLASLFSLFRYWPFAWFQSSFALLNGVRVFACSHTIWSLQLVDLKRAVSVFWGTLWSVGYWTQVQPCARPCLHLNSPWNSPFLKM